mmetsp:Transcript_8745/g.18134  ORF Transcript_8745/g.18134 Transcript_8745/m.18134 type:complete len:420 (-) Transcript_8745:776-2035(-)
MFASGRACASGAALYHGSVDSRRHAALPRLASRRHDGHSRDHRTPGAASVAEPPPHGVGAHDAGDGGGLGVLRGGHELEDVVQHPLQREVLPHCQHVGAHLPVRRLVNLEEGVEGGGDFGDVGDGRKLPVVELLVVRDPRDVVVDEDGHQPECNGLLYGEGGPAVAARGEVYLGGLQHLMPVLPVVDGDRVLLALRFGDRALVRQHRVDLLDLHVPDGPVPLEELLEEALARVEVELPGEGDGEGGEGRRLGEGMGGEVVLPQGDGRVAVAPSAQHDDVREDVVDPPQPVVPPRGDDVEHVGAQHVPHLALPVLVHGHVLRHALHIVVGSEVLEEERERHEGSEAGAVFELPHLVHRADELAVHRGLWLVQVERNPLHRLIMLGPRVAVHVKVIVLHEAQVPSLVPQLLEMCAPLLERQ